MRDHILPGLCVFLLEGRRLAVSDFSTLAEIALVPIGCLVLWWLHRQRDK